MLLVNSVDLSSFSFSLVDLFSTDMAVVRNTFHGVLLVAVGMRFVQSRKALYYHILISFAFFISYTFFFPFSFDN